MAEALRDLKGLCEKDGGAIAETGRESEWLKRFQPGQLGKR